MFKTLIFGLVFSLTAHAATCPASGTIKEYFLSLAPDKLSIIDDETGAVTNAADLEKAIETVDAKNGYLELQSKTIILKYTAALFKGKDGATTIAVVSDGDSVQGAQAFRCDKGEWSNVSKSFYPVLSFARIAKLYKKKNVQIQGKFATAADLEKSAHSVVRFRLPKTGRSIKVFASLPDASSEAELLSFTP